MHILDVMPIDASDPAENYHIIRNELKQYSEKLADKQEIIIANKIDLDPDGKTVKKLKKKLKKPVLPISAATGSGIKELIELLWQNVKELKG